MVHEVIHSTKSRNDKNDNNRRGLEVPAKNRKGKTLQSAFPTSRA
jgi:hypothetical protein